MQSRTRWCTFSKQGTYAATTATTMRTSKKKIRTLHLYHTFCAFLCLHYTTTKWPFLISSVRSWAFNSRIIHLHLTMSTKQNQNDEVWNWPFKWSFRCRFCLGCAHNQQNQVAQTLQVLSTTKIKQNHYQLNPSLEPKRGNSTTEKVWIVYHKDYRLDFRRPLGSGEECGLISPTAAGNRVDVFI